MVPRLDPGRKKDISRKIDTTKSSLESKEWKRATIGFLSCGKCAVVMGSDGSEDLGRSVEQLSV